MAQLDDIDLGPYYADGCQTPTALHWRFRIDSDFDGMYDTEVLSQGTHEHPWRCGNE